MRIRIGRRHTIRLTLTAVMFSAALAPVARADGETAAQIQAEVNKRMEGLPFPAPPITVPAFPEWRKNIEEFGAKGDGATTNTGAFERAIRACVKAGGGTVVVPPGTFLTGPIRLESNVNLHVARGGLVQFSGRIEDYPFIAGLDGRSRRFIRTPPIHAFRAKNVAITGEGVFDGAGEVWRYVKREKQTAREWSALLASGGVVTADSSEWWPSKGALEGEALLRGIERSGMQPTLADYEKTREFLRPDLVVLEQCSGLLLDGVTFQNSPRFHVRPAHSENVVLHGIRVLAPWFGQNNDGIDPTSCRNVIIVDCHVDVGDDGICLKPAALAEGQKPGPACENIVVDGCVVYRAHGGFVIGSESYGGVNNISVRNCMFMGTDVGLRFKSARGRGGLVQNVYIEGIRMRNIVNEAILFDMYYAGGAPEVESSRDRSIRKREGLNDRTPRFQGIHVKDVVCDGAERAVVVNGLPEMPVRDIVLQKLSVNARKGVLCVDAEGVELTGCRIVPSVGPVIEVNNGKQITVQGGEYPAASPVFISVNGEESENIRLVGVDASKAGKVFTLGTGVKPGAVRQD